MPPSPLLLLIFVGDSVDWNVLSVVKGVLGLNNGCVSPLAAVVSMCSGISCWLLLLLLLLLFLLLRFHEKKKRDKRPFSDDEDFDDDLDDMAKEEKKRNRFRSTAVSSLSRKEYVFF